MALDKAMLPDAIKRNMCKVFFRMKNGIKRLCPNRLGQSHCFSPIVLDGLFYIELQLNIYIFSGTVPNFHRL